MENQLQIIINKVNEMIAELEAMHIEIEDWDNPNDWKLKSIEWDKEKDKVWFKTEAIS